LPRIERARPLLGTRVSIRVHGLIDADAHRAIDEAFGEIALVHRLMSFHEAESDVSRLNREACGRTSDVHPATFEVLHWAREIAEASGGCFDITVAAKLVAWGGLPAPDSRHAPDPHADWRDIELGEDFSVRFRRPLWIDLGGIAKGFAVDRALDVLREHGVPQGLVNAGGDLAAFGAERESVFIRHPLDPDQLICQVQIANEALASSGGRLDLFEASSVARQAIVDPRTQEPPRAIAGVSVRAPSCLMADALTKVVMIQGDDSAALLDHYHAQALVVSITGEICVTPGWLGGKTLAA